MKIIHFCAGLEEWNGMANTARQFVAEDLSRGDDSQLTNNIADINADADVVMIHGAWLPVLWKASKKAAAVGAKLIIRPSGSYDPVRLGYHAWKKRLVAFYEHRMLKRADVVLATCEAEAEWIRAYEPKVKAVEITDLTRFFNLCGNGKRECRGDGMLHLLYLGRRHPLKGVSYLESAVRQLEELFVDASDVPKKLKLKIESSVFGVDKERVWEWCDVLVLPTLSENFGRVVAEALEHGKCAITTDGAPAWDPGDRGLNLGDRGQELGVSIGYDGRLLYLRGYREGTNEKRVQLLKAAIEKFIK